MSSFEKYQPQLVRAAFITSPLMGIFSLAPIFLFIQYLPSEITDRFDPNIGKLALAIGISAFNILIQWGINILLLSKMSKRKKNQSLQEDYKIYLLSFLFVFIYITLISRLGASLRPVRLPLFEVYPYIGALATNSFILILINLIIVQNERSELKLEKAGLEISQLITQQEQLKQQIHPHFLFNALGTLQVLIKKDSQQAYEYSGSLAKYLRASLLLAQNDVISIREELFFLEQYLALQKMRFGEAIQFESSIPEDIMEKGKLPVFSLQILAENAIKHNAFSRTTPMTLHLKYEEDKTLWMSNNKISKFKAPNSSGIGLQNLSKRFGHFTEHLPQLEDSEKEFKVQLKILGL